MFRLTALLLTIGYVCAGGYGGYGGSALLGVRSGFGFGLGGGYGGVRSFNNYGPITAAVHSTRSYEVVPVPVHYEAPIAQTIEIPANIQPINMIFRTQSSPLNLQQIHTPSAPTYQSSRSEDAPSVLTHENYKPVIQEYREVIQPFRRIEQRIQPVIENVHTVVARGENYAPEPLAAPLPLLARNNGYKK